MFQEYENGIIVQEFSVGQTRQESSPLPGLTCKF